MSHTTWLKLGALRNLPLLPVFRLKFVCREMSAKNLQSSSDNEKKTFIDSFDTVLSDCDGVLWLGGKIIPGAPDVMNNFKKMGKKVFFVTNNSTMTRSEFVTKCNKLGFEATEDDIISTAWLTAYYLKRINFNQKVYIVGPKAVQKELSNYGIDAFGVGPDNVNIKKTGDSGVILKEHGPTEVGVGAVVVGYDHHISLPKLVKAASYLKNPNTLFLGTNTDETYPHRGNFVWPGTGTFVAAVETCSQRKATIMGKPGSFIVEGVLKDRGMDPKRTIMIGDRCNTDIQFGTSTGMATLLVFTGVAELPDLEQYEKEGKMHLIPTYYTESIADLLPLQSVKS